MVVAAIGTILNSDNFGVLDQGQENVNVLPTIRKVIDVDRCGAGLGGVVPQHVAIAGIAGSGSCVGLVVE